MRLSDAADYLRAGCRLRRTSWPLGRYIHIHGSGFVFCFYPADIKGEALDAPFHLKPEDLTANDWVGYYDGKVRR